MRLSCPHCGERSHAEFTYLGDAAPVRPENNRQAGAAPRDPDAALQDFGDYVYLRANPAGILREYWQHTGGCRSWLLVQRNVTTHEIGVVAMARAALGASQETSR